MELEPLLERLSDKAEVTLRWGAGCRGEAHGVPLVVAWLGVGKVNTAAALACALPLLSPRAVVQVGIGGAAPGFGLEPGAAAVASEEVHLDSGALGPQGFEEMERLGLPLLEVAGRRYFNRLPVSPELSAELGRGLPRLPFGTAETVSGPDGAVGGGRFTVAVESMEGAAAAQVCLQSGVPFAELRGVSNRLGERDKGRWRVEGALDAAHAALARWLRSGAPGA